MSFKIFDDPSEDDMDKDLWRYPICAMCEEPIRTEHCYELYNDLICEDCIEKAKDFTENHMKERIRWR